MKNRILISEGEKKRIMSMHLNAGLKSILSEQPKRYGGESGENWDDEYNKLPKPNYGINVEEVGEQIFKSIRGLGTNEDSFWNALSKIKTKEAYIAVDKYLFNMYDEHIYEMFEDDFMEDIGLSSPEQMDASHKKFCDTIKSIGFKSQDNTLRDLHLFTCF